MNRLTAMFFAIALASSAEAQYPRPRTPGGTTSAVGQLPLTDTLTTAAKPGAMRQLVCRGAVGVHVPTRQDPSPRGQAYVTASLAYQRNSKPAGLAYEQLEPGACTWNPTGDPGIPAEPGVVHFDVDRNGTALMPDPTTLALWLGDPRHYWLFYVDDATNLSISHGAYGGRFYVADELRDKKPTATAGSLRRERLRCRGGNGLAFNRGKSQGNNLFAMTLAYKVAYSAAGPVGGGLEPGTCAWADRTDAKQEPGRIKFTTPGNAQLKQKQSGSAVDTTPTAAERWPDVHTIPAYMTDPAHYWTFAVSLADPDSALRHEAWRPSIPEQAAPPATGPIATTPSSPSTGPAGAYDPGRSTGRSGAGIGAVGDRLEDADPTSSLGSTWPLRNVISSTMLETAAIRFVTRPGAAPTVRLSKRAPSDEPGTGFRTFTGTPIQLYVHETSEGISGAYTASPQVKLERGTRYHYIIDVPGDGNRIPRQQSVGEVQTWRQTATVTFTEIQVVSDGDSDGAGELMFNFHAEDGIRTMGQEAGGALGWNDGSRNPISVSISGLAADQLRICVSGFDEDRPVGSAPPPDDPCTKPITSASSNYSYEWNTAKTQVDLTQHPGASASIPLYFRSGSLSGGSKVMFDVRGYVTVTRQ